MADFTILKTVWLHNRPWKRGSEDALAEAGFTRDQRKEQVKRGAIRMATVYDDVTEGAEPLMGHQRSSDDASADGTSAVTATDTALALAAEHGIDLAKVAGTGKDGRITKGDVEKLVASA